MGAPAAIVKFLGFPEARAARPPPGPLAVTGGIELRIIDTRIIPSCPLQQRLSEFLGFPKEFQRGSLERRGPATFQHQAG